MNDSSRHAEGDYHISLFRPTTKLAKFNRNLILSLLTVWAVGIFGFQILLRILEKPTPELAYTAYESVWENIKSSQASDQEKQVFIKSALSVLGKVTLAPKDRLILDNSVNQLTYDLIPDDEIQMIHSQIESLRNSHLEDANYQNIKNSLSAKLAKYLNVEEYSLEAKLLPLELVAAQEKMINIEMVERVMAKYLIHNQSILTDTQFLGFPFHYFYTAVFLLILFVVICLYYCIVSDRAMKRLGITEDQNLIL